MKRLKKHKNDILMIAIFAIIYMIITLILTHGKFIFASTTDFAMQHYVFPEYFRNLFYETKDFFPDFALNIGGGQNIYNFSYYGLFNPLILISYALPMIPMIYYLIGISFITVVASTFLFYKFLKSHNFKNSTCVIVSLLFLFATPIMYHAKRHIMFINYFPFLIGGLFGVDKFIKNSKSNLLIICTTLMIFTSFYYSVAGIIVLVIYGIYRYMEENEKKTWLKFLTKFAVPFIISILITAILLLPTAYTLLLGRAEAIKQLELWMLLIPNFKFLLSAYSPGITVLEFILIGTQAIDKDTKKEIRILAWFLIIIFMFPIFNYILNGTLYVNTKSLIPFLPLALLLIATSIETLLKGNKKITIYLLISTFLITTIASSTDELMKIDKTEISFERNYKYLTEKIIKKDKSFYRIANETNTSSSLNRVYNIDEYKSSIYSSTQNKEYQTWAHKKQPSSQPYRNNLMLTLSKNPISEAMMGEKYTISTQKLGAEYQLIDKKDGLYLYENNLFLPMIYATNRQLSEREYKNLTYPENIVAAYTKKIPNESLFKKVDFEIKSSKNIKIEKENTNIKIKAGENAKLILTPRTNEEDLTDKILFIKFKNEFNKGCHHEKKDQAISINGISNKLTCRDWKYHNENYIFHYIVISPNELEVTFSKAYYKLGEIEILSFPKKELQKIQKEIIPLKLNKKKTKGDKIVGTIENTKKSHVEITIPYDTGFKIKVDNKTITYKKSIQNGITFDLPKGKHKIEITYHSPWKIQGMIGSIIGLVLWIGITIIYKRKKSQLNIAHKQR